MDMQELRNINLKIHNTADEIVQQFNSTGELATLRDFIAEIEPVIEARAHELYDNILRDHTDYDQNRSEIQQRLTREVILQCIRSDDYLLMDIAYR